MLEVEGMDELLGKLAQIGANVDNVIDDALKLAAENLKSEMQNLVPFLSGELKDSIEVSNITGTGSNKSINVGPNKKTNWRAKFIEFGHKVRDKGDTVTNTYQRINTKSKKLKDGKYSVTFSSKKRGKNNTKTDDVPAQPFIEPAFLRTKEENKRIIANKIKEAIGI